MEQVLVRSFWLELCQYLHWVCPIRAQQTGPQHCARTPSPPLPNYQIKS